MFSLRCPSPWEFSFASTDATTPCSDSGQGSRAVGWPATSVSDVLVGVLVPQLSWEASCVARDAEEHGQLAQDAAGAGIGLRAHSSVR